MAKAIHLYTGGISFLIEEAVREDGRVFKRYQERDPRFGYKWQRWTATNEVWGGNMLQNPPRTRPAGFALLYLNPGQRRLPAA